LRLPVLWDCFIFTRACYIPDNLFDLIALKIFSEEHKFEASRSAIFSDSCLLRPNILPSTLFSNIHTRVCVIKINLFGSHISSFKVIMNKPSAFSYMEVINFKELYPLISVETLKPIIFICVVEMSVFYR
jgi:hypothetical protein